MLTIRDLFTPTALSAALDGGYIRKQVHPTEPLAILNYTEKAAYEGAWDPVTLACRGLIYHAETLEVLARPWRKFFNYGQFGARVVPLDMPVVVTDKADGSLGILHRLPSGGWAIATRGSFTSDQAVHATAVYLDRYAGRFEPEEGATYLFEIIYPSNRIVLDYGDLDDLVLLGAVDIATGTDVDEVDGWPGPHIGRFPYVTVAEALAASPRPNAEGLVLYLPLTGERLKIKQEDYVRLHRIVTGLTARTVWEYLLTGAPLAELVEPLPDEFHDWVHATASGIVEAVEAEQDRLRAVFEQTIASLSDGFSRKDFALLAMATPDKWALFHLLDGRDIRGELLKRAKPDPYLTPSGRTYSEDTA